MDTEDGSKLYRELQRAQKRTRIYITLLAIALVVLGGLLYALMGNRQQASSARQAQEISRQIQELQRQLGK